MDITKMKVAGWEARYYSLLPAEMERRLTCTRKMMEEKELSVILVFDMVKDGLFQWFMGAGISERPTEEILVVSLEGTMKICLTQECFTKEQQEHYKKVDSVNSQDSRMGEAENRPALYFGDIKEHLKKENSRVGIVHPEALRVTVSEYLQEYIPGITYVDVTKELEEIKAVKSPEELAVIKEVAGLHDRLFSVNPFLLRPGKTEADIVRELRYRACQLGAGGEDMTRNLVVDMTSAPMDQPAEAEPILYPGRVIREGDRINICLQGIFQDGYYGIAGRCYTLGKATESVKKNWETAVEAQKAGASKLRPGATIKEASEEINRYLREKGLPADETANIYGLAYQAGEAPCRYDWSENMPLQSGMVLAVKPVVSAGKEDSYCCADAYQIMEQGAVRMSESSQELIELYIQ